MSESSLPSGSPRHSSAPSYVVVDWAPVLHLVAPGVGGRWLSDNYGRTTTAYTMCGVTVTGLLDDASKYVVACLTCLAKAH